MKHILFPVFALLAFWAQARQQTELYQYRVDLVNVENDQVQVELIPPQFKNNPATASFMLPKTVPGTYSVNDYGRFIADFKAWDKSGREMPVAKKDDNTWEIANPAAIAKITYKVNDTYDTRIRENFVFEPAGSNIMKDKNFVMNTHCYFGYFDGMKRQPYLLNIEKPEGFYGSTSLKTVKSTARTDTYLVPSYMELVDAPMMYNLPDTSLIRVGGAEVLISVFSPNKILRAAVVAENISDVLKATELYLDGRLPVNKYAFIIYLSDTLSGSGSYGALEHSYSSMYYFPEADPALLAQSVRDIAAHEFFHIITPLNIHSEEIHDFDFNSPDMSKHLWLYEGVTEYNAGQVQVRHGLMSTEDYFENIRAKMLDAENYKDNLPFTEMSDQVLDKYKEQYGNVYQKGALIGMCLDLLLRDLSEGKYGVKDLLKDLSRKYGKDQPFKDDELFDQITALTYPQVREFFKKYVEGPEPLPFKELLARAGVNYDREGNYQDFTLGGIGLGFDPLTKRLYVSDVSELNRVGKALGYRQGDQLISINKRELGFREMEMLYSGKIPVKLKENRKMTVKVARKDEQGNEKEVKLKARARKVDKTKRHRLEFAPRADQRAVKIRNAWLNQGIND